MKKLIIENRTDKPMIDILGYIGAVVGQGRISNNGKQYCYATAFRDGVTVWSDLNKQSDRLVVQ